MDSPNNTQQNIIAPYLEGIPDELKAARLDLPTLESNIPPELRALRQFLLWRYEWAVDKKTGEKRIAKVPRCSTDKTAASNRSSTWNTFDGVLKIYQQNPDHFNGIGIVLGSGIMGVDLDGVLDVEGNIDPEALKLVDALPGYVEISPSGRGLHILIRGALPSPSERRGVHFGNVLGFDPANAPDEKKPGIEFYDETSPRYLTVTGNVWQGRNTLNAEDGSQTIAAVYWRVQKAHEAIKEAENAAKKAKRDAAKPKGVTIKLKGTAARKGKFDYEDDTSLIQHMREAKNGPKFSQLFDQGSSEGFPSPSEAVASLLQILAWWTQKDEARMDRLFRQSGLYDPGKWDRPQSGETLGSIEVRNACEYCDGQYEPDYHKRDSATSNLEIPNDINDELPTIVAKGRQLNPLLQEISVSLQADERLFRHGGGLVSIQDNGAIKHHTAEAMPKLLSRWANYVDTNNNGIFPPATAAKAVLFSIDDDDGIRPLERVVNIPTLRQDGTLVDTPGYDAASRLFYHPTGIIPPIPEHPTQEDARAAAAWILDMLCDFPFDDSSRANYLGLLLTFPVRALCGCVPMCLLDAPIAGSGKSLLAKIACITATGKAAAFGTQLGSEEETRKNITSRLRDGPSIIVMDNIEDAISSPILAMCLTAETWEDRLLGKSMLLALPVRAVFIATGNNLRTGKDMPRRCFYVKIDANAAQPWMRSGFKYELPGYAIENRGRIVASLLTMARSWICAGRPQGSNPILGSFESWCKVVGGILEYSGVPGFLGNLDEMRSNTADGEDDVDQWNLWMTAIYERFGEDPFTISQLADAINSTYGMMGLKEDVPYSLGEIRLTSLDRSWLTRLGKALHSHKGQVFNIDDTMVKLTQMVDKHAKRKRYKFVSIDDAHDRI